MHGKKFRTRYIGVNVFCRQLLYSENHDCHASKRLFDTHRKILRDFWGTLPIYRAMASFKAGYPISWSAPKRIFSKLTQLLSACAEWVPNVLFNFKWNLESALKGYPHLPAKWGWGQYASVRKLQSRWGRDKPEQVVIWVSRIRASSNERCSFFMPMSGDANLAAEDAVIARMRNRNQPLFDLESPTHKFQWHFESFRGPSLRPIKIPATFLSCHWLSFTEAGSGG